MRLSAEEEKQFHQSIDAYDDWVNAVIDTDLLKKVRNELDAVREELKQAQLTLESVCAKGEGLIALVEDAEARATEAERQLKQVRVRLEAIRGCVDDSIIERWCDETLADMGAAENAALKARMGGEHTPGIPSEKGRCD